MLAEFAGGIISGSLALIADAGHMLIDFASLALAWFAFRLARRPADWKRTYGFDRFQVIVAFANGITLFFVAGWIVYEAVERLSDPVPIAGPVMAAVAAMGLIVNIVAFAILHGADRDNLNIRGAALHVMGDLLGSVAALAAAGIVMATGWTPIDPILSVVVALLILRSAWRVIAASSHILLEGTPADIDIEAVVADLAGSIDGRISGGDAIRAIKARLHDRHGIDHATVEIERG